jgi:hypothetical protein
MGRTGGLTRGRNKDIIFMIVTTFALALG